MMRGFLCVGVGVSERRGGGVRREVSEEGDGLRG